MPKTASISTWILREQSSDWLMSHKVMRMILRFQISQKGVRMQTNIMNGIICSSNKQGNHNKKSPQIVGLGPSVWSQIFWPTLMQIN